MRSTLPPWLLLPLIVVAAERVCADGRIEINEARAAAGGVTPGDAPGFPVTLDAPGSYRLTSNLDLPDAVTTGISIQAPRVTLDLNGFAIRGPVACNGVTGSVTCSASGSGVGVDATGLLFPLDSVEVRNGVVSGVGADGVRLDGGVVRDLRVEHAAGNGVRVGDGSLVHDSAIRGVGGIGIATTGARASVRGNSIGVAGGGSLGPGMREIGGNDCDDGRCPFPRRRFYLTTGSVQGDAALAACAAGFHMASLWEVVDPSSLAYDGELGHPSGDRGQGAPTSTLGWIRTGNVSTDAGDAGVANCNAWTTTSGSGTSAAPELNWGDAVGSDVPPWSVNANGCGSNFRVWCVED
jgi:hypothetical protein